MKINNVTNKDSPRALVAKLERKKSFFRITDRLKDVFLQKSTLLEELRTKKDLTITALDDSNRKF